MRRIAFFFLFVLCVVADTPGPVEVLIQQAGSLPAEFAADSLIRISALDSIETARKIELLENAYQRAVGAQQLLKRRATPARLEGPAGFLNRAYAQDLDSLS